MTGTEHQGPRRELRFAFTSELREHVFLDHRTSTGA